MPESADPVSQLERAITGGDSDALIASLGSVPTEEIPYLITRLGAGERTRMFELLAEIDPDLAATLTEHLTDEQAAKVVSALSTGAAAAIVGEMDSDDQADVLTFFDPSDAEAILQRMDPEDAAEVRELSHYGSDTCGGLMITEYLSHPASRSIGDLLDDLRQHAADYAKYDVQYIYVTGDSDTLRGVIRLRDLILTPPDRTLESIMFPEPARVVVTDERPHLEHFFADHNFFAAPVVDEAGKLVGVVRRAAVERAHAEQAERNFLEFGGIIGGEELRSTKLGVRIVRRLAFLCPNILLNLVAASVVAVYEPTIAAVTALAIFLPILSDMSGCAGNQAVAVSIRELSLGLLKPRDILHTLAKELPVGIINGIVLGSLIGLIAWFMRGSEWALIGVVVGGAMAINSLVAVCFGGLVPLLLKRVGIDPALASSPLLTTVTDVCGFFITLNLATRVLL